LLLLLLLLLLALFLHLLLLRLPLLLHLLLLLLAFNAAIHRGLRNILILLIAILPRRIVLVLVRRQWRGHDPAVVVTTVGLILIGRRGLKLLAASGSVRRSL